MNLRVLVTAAAVCLLTVIAIAGCGSATTDVTHPSSTDQALPRATFVARARAACDVLSRAAHQGSEEDPSSLEELADSANRLVSTLERFEESLRSLVPPEADRAAFARYLRRVDFEVDLARRLRAVLGRPDLVPTANAYGERLARTLEGPQPDMSSYGLGDCDGAN